MEEHGGSPGRAPIWTLVYFQMFWHNRGKKLDQVPLRGLKRDASHLNFMPLCPTPGGLMSGVNIV